MPIHYDSPKRLIKMGDHYLDYDNFTYEQQDLALQEDRVFTIQTCMTKDDYLMGEANRLFGSGVDSVEQIHSLITFIKKISVDHLVDYMCNDKVSQLLISVMELQSNVNDVVTSFDDNHSFNEQLITHKNDTITELEKSISDYKKKLSDNNIDIF